MQEKEYEDFIEEVFDNVVLTPNEEVEFEKTFTCFNSLEKDAFITKWYLKPGRYDRTMLVLSFLKYPWSGRVLTSTPQNR